MSRSCQVELSSPESLLARSIVVSTNTFTQMTADGNGTAWPPPLLHNVWAPGETLLERSGHVCLHPAGSLGAAASQRPIGLNGCQA